VLTEAQLVALENAKTEKEAHGEFESEHPGYCGAQDTFYVGNLKGVGRVYQQTPHRHLHQGRLFQALRSQDADHGRLAPLVQSDITSWSLTLISTQAVNTLHPPVYF
jgi:hypothetical protein